MIFVTLTPVMRNDVLTLIIIPLTGKTFTGGFSFGINL